MNNKNHTFEPALATSGVQETFSNSIEFDTALIERKQPTSIAKKRLRRIRWTLIVLSIISIVASGLYQFTDVNPKFFDYAMSLRFPRLTAMVLAAFAIASSSLVFQTLIRNTIVTPCLLGMNSLYVLIHTVVVFIWGAGSIFATDPLWSFALDLVVMGVVSYLIYNTIFQKTGGNVLYILLIGTVLSTFFTSTQSSLTRIMDPNEYDALLNTLVANFSNVNAAVLLPSLILLALIAFALRKEIAVLDVLALGREQAINLGVDYNRVVQKLLLGVALYIAVATALVGPLSFMGLITANIARQVLPTHRHSHLIAASVLVGLVIVCGGQFIVEHIAVYSVPMSVFVTIGGGFYFLYLILTSNRRGL